MTHDICDPPSPLTVVAPQNRPLTPRVSDWCWLAFGGLALVTAIGFLASSFSFELELGAILVFGGALVMFESFITALEFLNRDSAELVKPRPVRHRWAIFLAALTPWFVGLGLAVVLMLGLFTFV